MECRFRRARQGPGTTAIERKSSICRCSPSCRHLSVRFGRYVWGSRHFAKANRDRIGGLSTAHSVRFRLPSAAALATEAPFWPNSPDVEGNTISLKSAGICFLRIPISTIHIPKIQISTTRRMASVFCSMYRWVMARERWRARACTSRRLPPNLPMLRAALVMNVRRPEWLEHPSNPKRRYQSENRFTMTWAEVDADRSVFTMWFELSGVAVIARHLVRACRNSFAIGIEPPVFPLEAEFVRLMLRVRFPSESVTIAQVRDAISLALNPALNDRRRMTRFRSGALVEVIKVMRTSCWAFVKTFACLVSIQVQISL